MTDRACSEYSSMFCALASGLLLRARRTREARTRPPEAGLQLKRQPRLCPPTPSAINHRREWGNISASIEASRSVKAPGCAHKTNSAREKVARLEARGRHSNDTSFARQSAPETFERQTLPSIGAAPRPELTNQARYNSIRTRPISLSSLRFPSLLIAHHARACGHLKRRPGRPATAGPEMCAWASGGSRRNIWCGRPDCCAPLGQSVAPNRPAPIRMGRVGGLGPARQEGGETLRRRRRACCQLKLPFNLTLTFSGPLAGS